MTAAPSPRRRRAPARHAVAAVVAALAVAGAACSDRSIGATIDSSGDPTDGAVTTDSGPSCGACSGCRGEQLCLGGGSSTWQPTCLARCDTTDDCRAGLSCVSLVLAGGRFVGPICLAMGLIKNCPGAPDPDACAPPGETSCSGDILGRPVTVERGLCGIEYVTCPNGCVATGGTAACR